MKLTSKLLCVSVVLLICTSTIAQNRPYQNVRRNKVTCRYEVVNGDRTPNNFPIYQEMVDSLNRVHTILFWDYPKAEVSNYIWHTFEGKQIVTTYTFKDKALRTIQHFTYTNDSLPQTETIMCVTPGDTAFYASLVYSYNDKNPITVEAKNQKGKWVWRTKSSFDSHNTEIKRTVKVKTGYFPLDSIVSLTCQPTYDSLGRISTKITRTKLFNGVQTFKHTEYGYNAEGLLSTITERDAAGNTLSRTVQEYNNVGILKFISRYNAADVLVDYRAIRYELYPSEDRRYRLIEY